MSLTNPKDFEIFNSLLPGELKQKIWYIPLRSNNKLPEVRGGDKWKLNENYRLSFSEAVHRLKWGNNVGIVALPGTLMFLDLDVREGKLLASQSFLDALESNPTMEIKSRNGGIQKYFLNDGKYANQLLKENNVVIGELRTDWQYVVSVGSHVEPDEHCRGEKDGTYRIQNKCPINNFQCISGLKGREEQTEKEETIIKKGILEHEQPQNKISEAAHLRDLLERGVQRNVPRVKQCLH